MGRMRERVMKNARSVRGSVKVVRRVVVRRVKRIVCGESGFLGGV